MINSAPIYPSAIRNVKNISTQSPTLSSVKDIMKLVIRNVIIIILKINSLFTFLIFKMKNGRE
jgi:protein tyrosine phosphatase